MKAAVLLRFRAAGKRRNPMALIAGHSFPDQMSALVVAMVPPRAAG
jgi:hypothetical protein